MEALLIIHQVSARRTENSFICSFRSLLCIFSILHTHIDESLNVLIVVRIAVLNKLKNML